MIKEESQVEFIYMSRTYRDPIHSEINLDSNNEIEKLLIDLIDSREMQRLRWIRQLGTGWFTYHGAEASRFQHSIGTMHVARKMFKHLEDKIEASEEEIEEFRLLVLVAALLHDLGHGPFSHSCEDILDVKHEFFTHKIILDKRTEVNQILGKHSSKLAEKVSAVLKKTYPVKFLSSIVSGQIDCDRFDYLLRDSHFTGTNYGNFDLERVISSITLNNEHDCLSVFEGKGTLAVEDYLYARYSMYLQVYLHKKCIASDIMFKKLFERVKLLLKSKKIAFLEQPMFNWLSKQGNMDTLDFIEIDDSMVWHHIKHWAREKDTVLRDLSNRFLHRKLFKATKYETDEEFNKLKEEKLKYLKSKDLNPEYYLDKITVASRPYSFYNPDTTDFYKAIFVENKKSASGLKEISELSHIVKTMIDHDFRTRYLVSI